MNNMEFTIHTVNWHEYIGDLQSIRAEVFMQEQHVSAEEEWDGLDEAATHFLVRMPDQLPVATARVLMETNHSEDRVYHIGRVAVVKDYRERGLGHQLMLHVIRWCQEQDHATGIYLHAQTTRVTFYKRLGFVAEGMEFMDAGIPHITMRYRPGA